MGSVLAIPPKVSESTPLRQSALLALPPQLRNQIYSEVLSTADDVLVLDDTGAKQDLSQIPEEALGMYYQSNTFRLTVVDNDTETAVAWLKTLSPSASGQIARLRIEVTSEAELSLRALLEKSVQNAWYELGYAVQMAGIASNAVRVRLASSYAERFRHAHEGDARELRRNICQLERAAMVVGAANAHFQYGVFSHMTIQE
ncbi:hypothetical protein LTR85_001969 [Meristemomyces frigidus]|nr:hypothetical protein LTR85_001969 [Meristemomyces frigidus]